MIVRRHLDAQAVAERAATFVVERARQAVAARGTFRLALAGGSTPTRLYEQLRHAPLDWPRVEVFFGDERVVEPTHEASNYRMAREALLDHVPLDATRVHRIEAEHGADEAARRYEIALGAEPLDLVLLGMGSDGHTLSLFPGAPPPAAGRRVVAAMGPAPHMERVTLTLEALAVAGAAMFLVTGADKAEMLARVLGEARTDAPSLPAARVRAQSPVVWMVDEAAAQRLTSGKDET